MKFRKKPIEIEAIQWTGDSSVKAVSEFLGANNQELENDDYVIKLENGTCRLGNLYIKTLEGLMLANIGDWVIKGVNGEFYPCKPDIFEKTYEKVGDK